MRRFFLILSICVICFSGCTESAPPPKPTGTTPPTEPPVILSLADLSNHCEGWGFRRIAGSRPEFTAEQIKNMERFDCIYMGAESEKSLYLTFDEGYENGYTGKILDVLKEEGVPAAFFITGPYLDKETDLVKRMVEEGHIVGNHSVHHPSMPSLVRDVDVEQEILGLDHAFYEAFGQHMKYFRPPRGEYSERTLCIANNSGYTNVFWSFAYQDWEVNAQKGSEYAYTQIMKHLHPGEVILLHAVSSDNAGALRQAIRDARKEGYEFRSLDEYTK